MARTYALLTSLKFGSQRWDNVPVPEIIARIERILAAEQEGFVTIKRMNEDQWFAHFWSDLLGGAHPPTAGEWNMPRLALDRARRAYEAGSDTEAQTALNQSVASFNVLHTKMYVYREALGKGGERSVTGIKGGIMVLGAVFSAGVGAAGASLLVGATASAGLTLAQEVAGNAYAVHLGVQQRVSFADIVLNTTASFVSSILSGVLCKLFARYLVRYWVERTMRGAFPELAVLPFRDIVRWAQQNGVNLGFKSMAKSLESPEREFLVGFFASFGADRLLDIVNKVARALKVSRDVTVEQFVERVAREVVATAHIVAVQGMRSPMPMPVPVR